MHLCPRIYIYIFVYICIYLYIYLPFGPTNRWSVQCAREMGRGVLVGSERRVVMSRVKICFLSSFFFSVFFPPFFYTQFAFAQKVQKLTHAKLGSLLVSMYVFVCVCGDAHYALYMYICVSICIRHFAGQFTHFFFVFILAIYNFICIFL